MKVAFSITCVAMENTDGSTVEEKAARRRTAILSFAKHFHWKDSDRDVLLQELCGLERCHDEISTLMAWSDDIYMPARLYDGQLAQKLSKAACIDLCDVLVMLAGENKLSLLGDERCSDEILKTVTPNRLHKFFARYDGKRRPKRNSTVANFIKRSDARQEFDLDIWLLQTKSRVALADNIKTLREELELMDHRNLGRVSNRFMTHMEEVFSIIDQSNGRITDNTLKPIDVFNYRARAEGTREATTYNPDRDSIMYKEEED